MKKKIGLLGGRFDPVHRAHLAMATSAANQLKLDEVRWIVTGKPVHKKTFASAKQRSKMVSLALKDISDKRMILDDIEVLSSLKGRGIKNKSSRGKISLDIGRRSIGKFSNMAKLGMVN